MKNFVKIINRIICNNNNHKIFNTDEKINQKINDNVERNAD